MTDEEFYCKSPLLDPKNFPVGHGRVLNSKYNILPFLCDLLKVANDETISPVLVEPPEFDISPFTDFTPLNNFGDPRVSMGETITETLKHFLPRVIAQTEVLQSGGTRLIDNYICDADGNPIKQSIVVPELNNTTYKYGSIETTVVNMTNEELMKPLTGEEIDAFVKKLIEDNRIKHAEAFVKFVKRYYSTWDLSLYGYRDLGVFVVQLQDKSKVNIRYFKFYDDVKNKVACLFGINKITIYHNSTNIDNNSLLKAISDPIPDYIELMSDSKLQSTYFSKVEKDYAANASSNYNSLFAAATTQTDPNKPLTQADINEKISEILNVQNKVEVLTVNKC